VDKRTPEVAEPDLNVFANLDRFPSSEIQTLSSYVQTSSVGSRKLERRLGFAVDRL